MNIIEGLIPRGLNQKEKQRSFQETPLLINGTSFNLLSQEAIMLTDLPQGGKYVR